MPDRPSSLDEAPVLDVATARFARRIVDACVLAIAVCVVLDFAFTYSNWLGEPEVRVMFDITREGSVPSWFSSSQLVAAGLVCAVIVAALRARGAGLREWAGWAGVAAFFCFMGIDDAAEIHERLGTLLGREAVAVPVDERGAALGTVLTVPTYFWQLFIAPLFVLAGVVITAFLWRRLRPHGLFRHVAVGMACFALAIAFDFVEGIDGFYANAAAVWHLEEYTVNHYGRVLEETLEMIGTTSFLAAFTGYLAWRTRGWTLRLQVAPHVATEPARSAEAEAVIGAATAIAAGQVADGVESAAPDARA